jgi:hypothetical protein
MKLIRCATMALFLFLPVLAHAQVICEPYTPQSPNAPGTAASQAKGVVLNGKEIGDWWVYWCPTGKLDVAGNPTWGVVSFAVLTKYRPTPFGTAAALWSVYQAPDRLAAFNELAVSKRIVPAVGSVDEYEWKTLLHMACLAAATPPYLGAPIHPLAADYCGPAPTAPAPPVDVYLTVGSYTLYTTSGGKLLAAIKDRKALPNSVCNCTALRIMVGTTPYCPLNGGSPTEVTACKKVVP